MNRDIRTFTSADELAAHLIAGNEVQLSKHRAFNPTTVAADIPQDAIRMAVIESQSDEATAGRLLRQAWVLEIKREARELFAFWVQEDAA